MAYNYIYVVNIHMFIDKFCVLEELLMYILMVNHPITHLEKIYNNKGERKAVRQAI